MWSLLARLLPGLMSMRMLVAVAIALASAGGSWRLTSWYYQSQKVGALEVQIARLKADRKRLDTILGERAREAESERLRADLWHKRWRDAKKDQIVSEWAYSPLPGPVVDRLRDLSP